MKCTYCETENEGYRKECKNCKKPLYNEQSPYQEDNYYSENCSGSQKTENYNNTEYSNPYNKGIHMPNYSICNRWIAFALCLICGYLGIHRFYVGKIGTGLIYLFTGGICGIGWLVDLILIACGTFTDKSGLILREKL